MKIKHLLTIISIAIAVNGAYAFTPKQKDVDKYLTKLYSMMNPADSVDRSRAFYIENAIIPALETRSEMPWGKSVPENEFIHFVLPLRVNNEAIDGHRPQFYAELRNRVKGLTMADAILEVNHWCHEKATYQPSDGRTHSPLQTVSSAIGRCGEESTFTVAALRAVGIPARQVYTPRWAHTDDNHAWVEAWADGQWYFLGACEPEPVLNLGWFNATAARGMLMHARVPGKNYHGNEEILDVTLGNTDINVTSNYAPVDTLKVLVIDTAGHPIEGAKVSFRIYNYAEFYPLASKTTAADGTASVTAGLGDMVVWATDGKRFGFDKFHVGKDKNVVVTLNHDSYTALTLNWDITPPTARDASFDVSPTLRAENIRRLAYEDSIRNQYTASFGADELTDSLFANLPQGQEIREILRKSRGNAMTIARFLQEKSTINLQKAINLLQSLNDKDLTDVTIDVLNDHFETKPVDTPLFNYYVLSPRIYLEELTPFRKYLTNKIPEFEQVKYKSNPQLWADFVRDSIDASLQWYPQQATMSPAAVYETRLTSPLSRDIFFVAGARSMGIPTRIDYVTGKTQWADSLNEWHNVLFEAVESAPATPSGELKLLFSPTRAVDDPQYYSQYTISRIIDGEPRLQSYPEFIPWSELFKNGQKMDAGQYMIVSGQRMADGSVLSNLRIINIPADTLTVDTLVMREDLAGIQVIGSFNSENLYLPEGGQTPTSILSTTGRGYYILGLIKPNHEPSNHALRDIAAVSSRLEESKLPIILLYETDEQSSEATDRSLIPQLPSTAHFGSDFDGKIMSEIITNLKPSSQTDMPIFIVADTFNRVVFVTQGYNIGLGRILTELATRL